MSDFLVSGPRAVLSAMDIQPLVVLSKVFLKDQQTAKHCRALNQEENSQPKLHPRHPNLPRRPEGPRHGP